MIDVNAFLGAYPWRRVPGTSPESLLAGMDRTGISEAWVSHLPGLFWKDPAEGNAWLHDTVNRHPRFRAVPTVHPGLPGWEDDLREAAGRGAVAVRADPGCFGMPPAGEEMISLLRATAALGVPLLSAVRLEDGRGRHPNDVAPDLPPWAVRAWLRGAPEVRLIITHADRAMIEEVHFGSTEAESSRVWWDLSWVWGPPEDHLAHLLATIGPGRFLFGTGQPLRLPESASARLDLLALRAEDRVRIASGNARQLVAGRVTR